MTKTKKIGISLAISGFIVGVVSLFLPPMGIIDTSVLGFLGWIAVVIGILFAWDTINNGGSVKANLPAGGSVEITKDNED